MKSARPLVSRARLMPSMEAISTSRSHGIKPTAFLASTHPPSTTSAVAAIAACTMLMLWSAATHAIIPAKINTGT
eukprot:3000658-Rhodomonas_salina.2